LLMQRAQADRMASDCMWLPSVFTMADSIT
jgi:hypothetical protein